MLLSTNFWQLTNAKFVVCWIKKSWRKCSKSFFLYFGQKRRRRKSFVINGFEFEWFQFQIQTQIQWLLFGWKLILFFLERKKREVAKKWQKSNKLKLRTRAIGCWNKFIFFRPKGRFKAAVFWQFAMNCKLFKMSQRKAWFGFFFARQYGICLIWVWKKRYTKNVFFYLSWIKALRNA